MTEESFALLPARAAPVLIEGDGAAVDRAAILAATGPVAAALAGHAEVVLACADRGHFVRALLAAWSVGAIVTLPSNLLPATLDQHAGLRVHDGGHAGGLDVRTLAASAAASDGIVVPGARTCVRLFTSGTTGVPKAIDKAFAQLLGEAEQLVRRFDLAGARVVCTVPLHHIYGLLFGVLAPLRGDATIVAVGPLHAEAVLAAIERFDADVLVSTPAQLRAFDVLPDRALARLRHVFSSGAPLRPDTAAALRDRLGVAPTEVFGSSETGGIATRTHRSAEPPWVPLPGVEVTADADGRMLLRSPWLDPSVSQPHATDDRISVGDAGFVHHGRVDDVIKVGGRRVALGDVVAKAQAIAGVQDAVAVALPAVDGRGAAIGLVVVTSVRTPEEIRGALAAWFDAAVLPRRIVCAPSLPRTAAGKLAHAHARALLGDAAPPRTRVHGDDRTACFDVEIEPDLPAFDGHFPGDPILPGAVLLEAVVLRSIEDAWPELGAPIGIPRAKFTERIGPGQRVRVTLERRGDRVAFTVTRAEVPCAAGSVAFAPRASG
ncbi:MAG: acyl-CoA synthetase [Myxococcales bacterium]|nr:acyl-CoA synthetase [Myxococcales bacterium]